MTTPIQQRTKDHKSTWRVCEVCHKPTNGLSSLCWKHRRYRGKNGSVKVSRPLYHRDYAHLIGLAVKYMKHNPPPLPILESMARLLTPPAAIPKGSRTPRRAERERLRLEMSRWSDFRYQKKVTDHGQWSRKADYSPRGVLAVLVAITAYVEERPRGWPHDSDRIETARAIIRLWRRPRKMGGRAGAKRSSKIPPSVLRGFAARLREFSMVGVYALLTARAILTEYRASEAERSKKLPRTYSPEEMRVLHDRQKRVTEAKVFEQQRAAFLLETPVADPGARTFGAWDGSAEMQQQIMAWSAARDRYLNYERRRKMFNKETTG